MGTGAGNVISGNVEFGILLWLGTGAGAVVEGNLIGTNASGTAALGNGNNVGAGTGGIYILSDNVATNDTIGGASAGDGNVISGNLGSGIDIVGANNNLVAGNYIGLNITGTTAVPNNVKGVALSLPNRPTTSSAV